MPPSDKRVYYHVRNRGGVRTSGRASVRIYHPKNHNSDMHIWRLRQKQGRRRRAQNGVMRLSSDTLPGLKYDYLLFLSFDLTGFGTWVGIEQGANADPGLI